MHDGVKEVEERVKIAAQNAIVKVAEEEDESDGMHDVDLVDIDNSNSGDVEVDFDFDQDDFSTGDFDIGAKYQPFRPSQKDRSY